MPRFPLKTSALRPRVPKHQSQRLQQSRRTMATPSNMTEDLKSFQEFIKSSDRVLALLGAGISASSGLATFRGAGGLWRNHQSTSLATPGAFEESPALVWQFYSCASLMPSVSTRRCANKSNDRRHKALEAKPNAAHYALAELSRKMPNFLTLSQNVDGLSPRANHPSNQLKLLHGNLFEVRCTDARQCGYKENNFEDPIVPALAIPTDGHDPTTNDALAKAKELDISDASVPISKIPTSELPRCPQCKEKLLRPNVVWFGENLPPKTIEEIDEYLEEPSNVDLIMVIGTSAKVYPAAGYIYRARQKGARVCVVNMDANDAPPGGWESGDWFFQGDAAQILPKLLEPVIGELKLPEE